MATVVTGKGSFRGFGETTRSEGDGQDDVPIEKSIGSKLQQIAYNVNQLTKLNENIGTDQDTTVTRNKTNDIMAETNKLTKDTNALIRQFSESEPTDQDSKNKWKIQVRRLKESFHEQLTSYQDIQKTICTTQRNVIRTSLIQSKCYDVHIDDSGAFVKDGHLIQVEEIQADVDLDLIKEREHDIQQLEQDIIGVNEIFKDLAGMVLDQGEMIDKIEENIEHVTEDIEVVVEELKEADDNMQAIRKKRLIIGTIVTVVILVIVLIIVLTQVT